MNHLALCKKLGAVCLALSVIAVASGCSMKPEDGEVRVEINEKLQDHQKDRIQSKLSALTDGNGMTKSQTINGIVTFVFGGVDDVKQFADKITFARVVEVKEAERTVVLSVQ